MPGSHWEAVSPTPGTPNIDSYGLPPFKYEIMAYLQRHSISWTFNRHRLQGITSNVCGYYCCVYALQSQGTIHDVVPKHVLPARYTRNDKMVVQMFCDQFGVSRLRPVTRGAVVQFADIKVRTFKLISPQCH